MRRLRIKMHSVQPDWLKFTLLQSVYWFAMSVGNYQNVYLQSRGFNASTIGLINAVLSALNTLVVPMWGMVSDRIRSIRKVFLLTLIVGNLTFLFIPGVVSLPFMNTPLMLLYMSLVYLFRNPANSLMDNWLVRYCMKKELNYGSIRSFGSLSFSICGVLIAGFIAANGTAWTFPVCSMLMILVVIVSLRTEDSVPDPAKTDVKASLNPMVLFRNYHFATFLPYAFLLCMVNNGLSVFIPYLLTSVGEAGSRSGLIFSYTALLEIPMLLAAAPLRRRVPLYILSIGSAVSYALAGILLGTCAGSLTNIVLFMTFYGLGNGLMISANANYIYTLTPEHLKATAQSLYVAATSLGAIAGNLMGGSLIDLLGAKPLYLILGIAGACTAVYLSATILLGRKIQVK